MELNHFLSLTHEQMLGIFDAYPNLQPEQQDLLTVKRRRFSLENKPEKWPQQLHADRDLSRLCKVVVLGDESTSGQVGIVQLFTLPDFIAKSPEILDAITLPPCDIQRKSVFVEGQEQDPILEVWVPPCTQGEHSIALRQEYYNSADAFVLVYSIIDPASLAFVMDQLLPEVMRHCAEKQPGKEVPLVLVGNHVELRGSARYPHQVQPTDAIQMAQQAGLAKYIEVFSGNILHAQEVMRQTAAVAMGARERNDQLLGGSTEGMALQSHVRTLDDAVFRSCLTVPDPVGRFDFFERKFEIVTAPGVVYLLTLDGTEPTRASSRYVEPLVLKKPYPKAINVIGVARNRFASKMVSFQVPEEASLPKGHFDMMGKAFIPYPPPSSTVTYHYSTDESTPSTESPIVESRGLRLDALPPLHPFASSSVLPSMIKVVAVEDGKFRSSVAEFKPIDVLPTPSVRYDEKVRMMTVDTLPHLDYRYTLDGSTPSWLSTPYTGPILIPNDAKNIRVARVAAFPRYALPSKACEIKITSSPVSASPRYPVKMNKAAIIKQNAPTPRSEPKPSKVAPPSAPPVIRPQRPIKAPLTANQALTASRTKPVNQLLATVTKHNMAPVSPTTPSSPPSTQPDRSATASPRTSNTPTPQHRGASPARDSRRGLSPSPSVGSSRNRGFETEALLRELSLLDQQRQASPPPPPPPPPALPQLLEVPLPDGMAECRVEGNKVEFSFERPLTLTKMIISTPGGGLGPDDFEIVAADGPEDPGFVLAHGYLQDAPIDQEIDLFDETQEESFDRKYRILRCFFNPLPGQPSFQILDVQLFGISSPDGQM